MSVDELISIERVEFETTKDRIQETYVITPLTLSKLFKEVLSEVEMNILPILNVRILLYALRSVPFTNEVEGVRIIESLSECMEYQLYGKSSEWTCKVIASKLQEIRDLILYDYIIEGSLIVYHINQIEWDWWEKIFKIDDQYLSLNGCCILKLPKSFASMKHLKYLDLKVNNLTILPEFKMHFFLFVGGLIFFMLFYAEYVRVDKSALKKETDNT